jgi:hypothetical protein
MANGGGAAFLALAVWAGCGEAVVVSGPDMAAPIPDGGAAAVALQFGFMGCNRINGSDWTAMTNDAGVSTDPSSANIVQLQQTFADFTHLSPIPPYFFFTGDLVVNEAPDDGGTLAAQLAAWYTLASGDPSKFLQRTTLVPITGNHELLVSGKTYEEPNPNTDPVWTN